jgi:uncharacterized membrane protein YraQ (UPF0718 family)
MEALLAFLRGALVASGQLLAEAAPFLLGGLLIAGLLAGAFRRERVERLLGGPGFAPIARAALLGVPLPLCSCGVVPAAISLRRHGASRGATVSFLVSTPETGVDSIAISYALLGPLVAIARPVAAFASAVVAGVAVGEDTGSRGAAGAVGAGAAPSAEPPAAPPSGAAAWTRRGVAHAIEEILGEIGPWLLAGVLLGGLLAQALPAGFFSRVPGGEIVSMLAMLAAGIPLYICASASTPVAASLMEKGLSPGAALVLLLAGPATNIATILIVARELGRRVVVIYLAVLSGMSLLFGLALNALWSRFGGGGAGATAPGAEIPTVVSYGCAAILLALIAASAVRAAGRRPDGQAAGGSP